MHKILTESGWKPLNEDKSSHVAHLIASHVRKMASSDNRQETHQKMSSVLATCLRKHSDDDIIDGCKKHCDKHTPSGKSFAHGIIADHKSGAFPIKNPVSFAVELAQRSGLKASK